MQWILLWMKGNNKIVYLIFTFYFIQENVTLLHWAAINNRLEIVNYLVSRGAIVDAIGGELESTPLQWATRQGHLPMV